MKLLLTARTHCRDKVIGRSTVSRVELGTFSDPEAREFLQKRKPDASGVEVATALARSSRNARVLDYLVQTWDKSVRDSTSVALIEVPEIIAQRCTKIVSDLHVAGWPGSEITEFFVALSLLPPPIPLDELANALGWSAAQVGTPASDLAPMLEMAPHGAIFRDEPTETYPGNILRRTGSVKGHCRPPMGLAGNIGLCRRGAGAFPGRHQGQRSCVRARRFNQLPGNGAVGVRPPKIDPRTASRGLSIGGRGRRPRPGGWASACGWRKPRRPTLEATSSFEAHPLSRSCSVTLTPIVAFSRIAPDGVAPEARG